MYNGRFQPAAMRIPKSARGVHVQEMTLSQHRRIKRKQPRNWCYIYALREESSEMYRYVGQTQINPRRRLTWHWRHLHHQRRIGNKLSPAQQWLKDCANNGATVVIEIIDYNGRLNISEAVW